MEPPRNAISLPDEPLPQWRTYDISSTIALQNLQGKARLWLPLVQYRDTHWERSPDHHWQGNFQTAGIYRDPVADMGSVLCGLAGRRRRAEAGTGQPDRHARPPLRHHPPGSNRRAYRNPASLPAIDRTRPQRRYRATYSGARHRANPDPLAQGKAIYDWVVENTTYDPTMNSVGHRAHRQPARKRTPGRTRRSRFRCSSSDCAAPSAFRRDQSSACAWTDRGCSPASGRRET